MRERGAAERAMLWHVYLSEEIFTDETKFTIAAGGYGSRTGLRDQKNRLNLDQFVRHIWMSTDGDECPPEDTYVWSINIEEAPTLSHVQIANAIASIKGFENNTISRHGFMGNLNVHNVNEESDWFECMKKVKYSIKHVNDMLKANGDDIDHVTRAQIVRCVDRALEGCRRIIDLRRKKIWQYVRSHIKDGLDIRTVAQKSHDGLSSGGEKYKRPNRNRTFDDCEVRKMFDADIARFNAKWEEVVNNAMNLLEGDEHLKALETFEGLYSELTDIIDITEYTDKKIRKFTSFADDIERLARGEDDS